MSANNPFRSNISPNVQQNVEDWGKSKFKPQISKGGYKGRIDANTKNPFNKKNCNRKSIFHKNNEKLRFNEVAKGAKPENATPWNKYKDELMFKQRDDEQGELQANMESGEAKAILKQRQINYRRSLVERKKKEPTKWENFEEDNEHIEDSKDKGNKSKKFKSNAEINLKTLSKSKFKRNKSGPNLEKDFISKDLLQNFDSKKLSYEQNDKLRTVITKTTILSSQTSLQNVVNELKKKKNKQRSK